MYLKKKKKISLNKKQQTYFVGTLLLYELNQQYTKHVFWWN